MPLFLDRLPLHAWVPDGLLAAVPRWSVSLPVIPTESGRSDGPPRAQLQRWVMDTAFSGEAFAWWHHLQEVGLNPDADVLGSRQFSGALGAIEELPLRDADLWLFGNISALGVSPWRIELGEGLAFRNMPHLPNPELNTPLIGIRALRRAGLRVYLDFARGTVSVWTPGPWYAGLALPIRRWFSGRATLPMPWSKMP